MGFFPKLRGLRGHILWPRGGTRDCRGPLGRQDRESELGREGRPLPAGTRDAGSLGYTGRLEDLPPSVIKITGTDPQKAASSLKQGLRLLSQSGSGTSLYAAPSDAVAPDEVRSVLESSNVAFRDVVEVRSLDERILAFL